MRGLRKFFIIGIITFIMAICFAGKVSADSYLHLDNLEFHVEINKDASINVTEYWYIDIEETNTIYKSFKIDYTKYSNITDVKVTDLATNQKLNQQSNWKYHVDKGYYYGSNNPDGDFEIGWGVGLDNSSGTRKYKIEYKVKDVITKYNDYAELYWQLLGEDFGISADKITGLIMLPENANSKEDIKVWGHLETLNGTIYATDINKIEFNVNKYRKNNMLEIRTLFPTQMITSASRILDEDALERVVKEETKWAEEANQRRELYNNKITAIVVTLGLILNIIFIITIIRANKNPIKNQKRFVPEQEMEYFRDIPRANATPGEAVQLINKNLTKVINSNYLGNIFSAVLLNLKLKGYLDFEIDKTKPKKEQVSINIKKKQNTEELLSEEKEIYNFLNQAVRKKEERVLTLKELQKIIKSNPQKIQRLAEQIGKDIYSSLKKQKLLDEKQIKAYNSALAIIIFEILFLISFLIFDFAIIKEFNVLIKAIMSITTVLGIISIAKKIGIVRKINQFTQKGVNEIKAWKCLKKYMEDFSLLEEKEIPSIVVWEKFLVYATAYGISKKVLKQLKLVYPNFEEITGTDYSMMYLMLNTDFNNTFSSAISSTMSSAYSSGSGSGGGFSGGGGGGGGRRWRWRTLKSK